MPWKLTQPPSNTARLQASMMPTGLSREADCGIVIGCMEFIISGKARLD
jgi:hypothetical protein